MNDFLYFLLYLNGFEFEFSFTIRLAFRFQISKFIIVDTLNVYYFIYLFIKCVLDSQLTKFFLLF